MTLETMQRKLAELEAKEQTEQVAKAIAITSAAIARKVERQTATAPWWRSPAKRRRSQHEEG